MITIRQIAKLAGVSPSTVSRCLNDHPAISQHTGERIKSIARELGFEFNFSARSLRSRRTETIGIIYGENFYDEIFNPFSNNLNKNISDYLAKVSFNAIIDRRINPFTGVNNLKKLVKSMKVEGLILINISLSQEEIDIIKEADMPVVLIGEEPCNDYNIKLDSVVMNSYELGLVATKYLLDLRHKDIITITTKKLEKKDEYFQMTKAFIDGMEEKGIKVKKNMIIELDVDYEEIYKKIKANFSKKNKISAIYAQNETFGIACTKALKELGYRIPEDISIVVSGSDFYSQYSDPKLTTITHSLKFVSENAVELLLKKINKKVTYKSLYLAIEPKLIVRESSAVNKL